MSCLVDVPGWSALFWRETKGEWMWWRGEVKGETGVRGERGNCSQYVIYEEEKIKEERNSGSRCQNEEPKDLVVDFCKEQWISNWKSEVISACYRVTKWKQQQQQQQYSIHA